MTGRDEARGICSSVKEGEPAAGLGLAGAVTVSDALGERMEIKRRAAKAWDTGWGTLGELDIWVTATVRVRAPSLALSRASPPTESRTFLHSLSDTKPWLGVQAHQTWEERPLPCLER